MDDYNKLDSFFKVIYYKIIINSAFSKPKLVATGAVSHKICNMIFAILRDNKAFKIITPKKHKQYNASKCDVAA